MRWVISIDDALFTNSNIISLAVELAEMVDVMDAWDVAFIGGAVVHAVIVVLLRVNNHKVLGECLDIWCEEASARWAW